MTVEEIRKSVWTVRDHGGTLKAVQIHPTLWEKTLALMQAFEAGKQPVELKTLADDILKGAGYQLPGAMED